MTNTGKEMIGRHLHATVINLNLSLAYGCCHTGNESEKSLVAATHLTG